MAGVWVLVSIGPRGGIFVWSIFPALLVRHFGLRGGGAGFLCSGVGDVRRSQFGLYFFGYSAYLKFYRIA